MSERTFETARIECSLAHGGSLVAKRPGPSHSDTAAVTAAAASKRVRPRDLHDSAMRCRRRHPEGVALALDDERGDLHGVELGQPALARIVRLARRVKREREAEHRRSAGLGRSATGDASARRAAARDERNLEAELLDHGNPGRVELAGRSR